MNIGETLDGLEETSKNIKYMFIALTTFCFLVSVALLIIAFKPKQ